MVNTEWSAVLAMQRATHATLHALAAQVADLGLTAAETNALANLADGHPRTASELSALVGTPPTTLTGVLDRLERRGHLTRDRHPTDRRAVLLRLTPDGRRAARKIRRAIATVERHTLRDLDAAALDGLRAGLDALAEAAR